MRILAWVLLGAAALYALAVLNLYLTQRSLIYYPQPRRAVNAGSVMKLPVPGAQLNVTTRQLNVPKAVVYFGGNAEDVSGSLADLEAAFPDYSLYLMHYRGYGGSTGKPTEAALSADALALFDEVRRQHPEVTVVGRSLGSGVAVRLASARPVSRLVLVTAYDSMADLAAQLYPMFPIRRIMTDKYDSWRYAPLVNAPTTLVTAQHDELIPRASSDLLLTRFKNGVARQVVIPGVGHNTISEHSSYAQALSYASPR